MSGLDKKKKEERRNNANVTDSDLRYRERKQAENSEKAKPERLSRPFSKLGTVRSDYEAL